MKYSIVLVLLFTCFACKIDSNKKTDENRLKPGCIRAVLEVQDNQEAAFYF